MSSGSDFLSFACKRTDRLDIKSPIGKYVTKAYGKEQAEDIFQDVEEVTRRRTEVVAVSGGGASDGAKEILASYYRALCVMETRFPMSRDSGHAQVAFYWMNSMNPRKKCKQMNIHFEKAAVLFNIAAHLSQQAVQQNRESQEGYKTAIQHFQEAAAVFAHVRDVALKVENPKPSDLSADFLTMAEKLMLAEGQECVFWRALKDQKSALVLSRVAKQASILYSETLAFVASPSVKEDLDRTWQDLIQSKSWLFEALCQHHGAEGARAKEDISTEISRLNQAVMLLQKLQKNGKFVSNSLPSMIKELHATSMTRLQNAERDNASVYLKRVLPFNELPVISGAQLVKLGECLYLDASSEHIFAELIPEPITRALSRYSELVDNIIRKQTDKLNGATDDARVKLKQYELPEMLDAVTTTNASMLPEALRKELEEIEQCGGLAYLDDMMNQLNGLKTSSKADLAKIEADLDNEAAQDSQLRERYGQQWTAQTSASQTAEFRKLIGPYHENFSTADISDRVIETKLADTRARLELLSVTACVEHIPKLEAGMVNTTDLEPQTLVANIRNCMEQLDAVSDERAGLDESLKDMKNRDNLLPKLVATGVGSHEDLFKVELQKYDVLVNDVAENIKKQQELLDYIREALDSFKQTFDIPAWKQKIDKFCKDVKADITTFYEVRNNVGEGMRFYMNLKSAIDTLKQQAADFIMSRNLDREDRLELLKAREKPMGAAQAQAPPAIPAEPPAYTPPPPIPPEPTSYSAPPPVQSTQSYAPPPTAPTQTYTQPQYTMASRQDSSSGHASAPPPPMHPTSAYVDQGPTGQPIQHDPMVESPNPYVPPPAQHQVYNQYAPQGHYAPQQGHYAPPPGQYASQPHYQPARQAGAPPTGFAMPDQASPPPGPYYQQNPGQQPLTQYQQGGYYQPGQPQRSPYPYQQAGAPPPPQDGQYAPPPPQGYQQHPPYSNYNPYQQ